MTIVLGLDPGTRHFGWGVVEQRAQRHAHVAHGQISTKADESIAARLVVIDRALLEVLSAHGPGVASVEALFFAKVPLAASTLGHARGAALLVCARGGLAN